MTIRELMSLSPQISFATEDSLATGSSSDDAGASDDSGSDDTSNDSGGNPVNVFDMIQDPEIREQAQGLEKFKSVDDLAKSYKHLEKLQGKEHLPIPTDENDSDAWNEVFKRLGKPDDPNQYEFPSLAEDAQFQPDETFTEGLKQKAHELGLTPKQASELYRWYAEDIGEQSVKQSQEQAQKFRQESEQQLRKEFGNEFDNRVKAAQQAVHQFGGDDLAQLLEQTGLGNHPAIVKAFAEIGVNVLSEDKIGGSGPRQFGYTPDQAMDEISRLKQSDEFMQKYMDRNTPGHQDAVERMTRLYQAAYPDQ